MLHLIPTRIKILIYHKKVIKYKHKEIIKKIKKILKIKLKH